MIFYSGHLRILPIFTTVLCLLLLLLPRFSIGAFAPQYGSGVFSGIYIEYDWHVDENNQVIVEKSNVNWHGVSSDWDNVPYPCEDAWNKLVKRLSASAVGKFQFCRLSFDIGGIRLQREYHTLKSLTFSELQSFIGQTGVIGTATSPSVPALFSFGVYTQYVPGSMSYLPKPSGSNGVPPTEVKPPLKCSIANGVINHGSLSGSAVDQHSAKTTVSISCNGPATLSVRSEGYSPTKGLMMNGPGTLYSKVNIGGVSAERGVQVSANNSTTVSVTSVLQGKGGVVAGAYSGSVVLVATII